MPETPGEPTTPATPSTPTTDLVVVAVEGAVGRITLNAPARLNAVDPSMLDELLVGLASLDADEDVRVIALTGAGRGFCAGADIGTGDVQGEDLDATLFGLGDVLRAFLEIDTPVVALVHGVAAGAGVSLALACDYVLASDAASFVLAFARIGLMPDGGATALVAANIGRARALRLALTGEKLDATTAGEWGLVSEVTAAADFDARAEELLAHLAASAPLAAAATREAINNATLDLEDTLAVEERGQSALLRTEDFVEGVMAFRERRSATFVGR
jgi:enoyl-CoA hydratase/carnithine racemase